MKPAPRWRLLAAMAALLIQAIPASAAGPQWEVKFFHDKDDSQLQINDFVFPSAKRGIACGFLVENDDIKPRALVTSDGGETWDFVETRAPCTSLYFLNDSLGWMVTDGALFQTVESGRSWQRIARVRNIDRVWFVDKDRGWAVGPNKTIRQTTDGGHHWEDLKIPGEPDSDRRYTAYGWIDFRSPQVGAIVGWNRPPRPGDRSGFPDWMQPETTQRRRQWPSSVIIHQTTDGGQTWDTDVSSMFGRVVRLRIYPSGKGLTLVWFDDQFDWPSEVYKIDLAAGTTERAYREAHRAITDVLISGSHGYLAGFEPPGSLWTAPIPGRLVILRSSDLTNWEEMDVDYRAVATRATLAAPDPDNVWVATDTGMILKLRNSE